MAEKTTCNGCKKSFEGARLCHCCACHKTFSSITAFNKHQNPVGAANLCQEPEKVGLLWTIKPWGGYWGYPSAPEGFWSKSSSVVANPERTQK